MSNKNLYKTKDQYIASLLYALKQRIIDTVYENNVCYFLFDDEKTCENIVDEYFRNNLQINPKDLFDAYKTIKTIIYRK